MSENQQFSHVPDLGGNTEHSQVDTVQQKQIEKHPIDPKKRAHLKNLVKRNTLCHHSQIYTQANVVCRRISYSYEDGKISDQQAMELMFEAHEQMTHRGLPKDVVATELHKRLDKLENNDKTSFAIIMANTNSSVHSRVSTITDPNVEQGSDPDNENKYSESYWAEII